MPLRSSLAFRLLIAAAAAASPVLANGPLAIAREQAEAHHYRDARRTLEPVLETSPGPEAVLLMARICNRLTDWRCSLEHAREAVSALPASSEAHYELALALRHKMSEVSKVKAMFSLGDYKRALVRAIELDPNNLDAREEQIGFLVHSPGFAGRDLDQAELRIGELEALDWPRGRMMRAELERERDDPVAAEAIYREVLERHPEHSATRVSYGFFCLGEERWRAAAEQFAAVGADAEPRQRYSALYQSGRTRVLGGFEAETAVRYFAEYIETADENLELPSRSDAYWRQGMAYEQLGKTAEARSAYRQALALDAGHKSARQALERLGG